MDCVCVVCVCVCVSLCVASSTTSRLPGANLSPPASERAQFLHQRSGQMSLVERKQRHQLMHWRVIEGERGKR